MTRDYLSNISILDKELLKKTEGIYLLESYLTYTRGSNHYPIPDNYMSTKTWLITILSENNKLKVLKDFDLNVIFTPERATKIKELWNSFNNLYNDIHKLNIFGNQFQQKAYQWLKLFLTKSQGNINSSGFVCGLY
ncbi:9511_t:CDS:2 [Scutellospora calospora]|uniref:9511_t:CDS:1 n=1 Tax=Scutellospora calospora TaxID=85575 RepID=A0ACA9JUC1_9GLOM|nr:9511_t:CDS:2 [Scutellospora calospora]